MASEQFNTQLKNFNIELDEDATEYIGGMLSDMTLTDHDEVRESTETFLIDANIDDDTRDNFFQALFSNNLFQGNPEPEAKQVHKKIAQSTTPPPPPQLQPQPETKVERKVYQFFFFFFLLSISPKK